MNRRMDLCPRLFPASLGRWLREQQSAGLLPWWPDALERLQKGDLVGLRMAGRTWPPSAALRRQGTPDNSEPTSQREFTVAVFAEALHHYIGSAIQLPAGWAPTRLILEAVLVPITLNQGYLLIPRGTKHAALPAVSVDLPVIGEAQVYLFTERILADKPVARAGATQ